MSVYSRFATSVYPLPHPHPPPFCLFLAPFHLRAFSIWFFFVDCILCFVKYNIKYLFLLQIDSFLLSFHHHFYLLKQCVSFIWIAVVLFYFFIFVAIALFIYLHHSIFVAPGFSLFNLLNEVEHASPHITLHPHYMSLKYIVARKKNIVVRFVSRKSQFFSSSISLSCLFLPIPCIFLLNYGRIVCAPTLRLHYLSTFLSFPKLLYFHEDFNAYGRLFLFIFAHSLAFLS